MLRRVIAPMLLTIVVDAHAVSFRDVFGGIAGMQGDGGTNIDRVLEKISERENRKLPQVIEKNIRLDKVTADPGAKLTYHYTMLNQLSAEESAAEFNKTLAPQLKTQVCGNKNLEMFFRNGVTVSYTYQTQEGHQIGKVDVAPADCGYRA